MERELNARSVGSIFHGYMLASDPHLQLGLNDMYFEKHDSGSFVSGNVLGPHVLFE